ncbi:MAG: gliding motility-associated C-terminal domain-containing protein [Bacteroidales bacterium]|nr:gliding motility-associated C-terminal domain-containing protein [Bacteroidales bacterium]
MLSNIKEVPDVISRSSAVNNNFSIVASGIKTLDVQIFNRWGLQIFDKIYNESTIKTEDYNINGTPSTFKKYFIWDGTNNKGSKAAAGTYFFIIKATKMDNSTEDKKGTITLLD